jgi:hypothetical protein
VQNADLVCRMTCRTKGTYRIEIPTQSLKSNLLNNVRRSFQAVSDVLREPLCLPDDPAGGANRAPSRNVTDSKVDV